MTRLDKSDQKALEPLFFNRLGCSLGAAMFVFLSPFLLAQVRPDKNAAGEAKLPFATGPEVGQKIPSFSALDQRGKMQDFNSIRGPNGAMIVFFRSADW
jgi:hypothetical protein